MNRFCNPVATIILEEKIEVAFFSLRSLRKKGGDRDYYGEPDEMI